MEDLIFIYCDFLGKSPFSYYEHALKLASLRLHHSCLKTNSDTSAEARVANDNDSDGKSYTHSCCSWKVTYIFTEGVHGSPMITHSICTLGFSTTVTDAITK